ncbi:ABC transporter permease subunit [Solirubrobacter sp. CPCC 204708]|uniref:ABC transporter permease subunit n=1 Tax=Solirubrobacter deserti TaxID=2282478 RepID=A0ABT4RFC4_9ACTN|nr:ABC transporter permease subunit [Solirubrobacter deserti]MBE2319488.1 ABC transporter permease subunit [Solirubrobacter deserti]MDA0137225.1 ABC transporter permease subunit [Solirubrobacter deserti]
MTAVAEAASTQAKPRERWTDNKWVQRAIVWGALLALYELLAIILGDFYLASLEDIVSGFGQIVEEGRIPTVLTSLEHLLVGFALAAAVGIPIGVAMGRSFVVDQVIGMYVRGLFVTSLAALLPLLIILFGVGFRFQVAVVFLFSVFFVIVNTAAGARAVPRQLMRTAEAFCVSPTRRFTAVVLPSSLPYIVIGLRLAVANAYTGMVLAELWVGVGTGGILKNMGQNRDLPKFFAMVLLITALAAFSSYLIRVLEKRLMPWAKEVRAA